MKLSGLILTCLLIPISIAAQSLEYVNSGLWWSRAYDIAADSNNIVCVGDNLFILSRENENQLKLVGGLSVDGGAYSVATKGNYAFLAVGDGLQIVDYSEPWNCRSVGFCSWDDGEYIALNGDFAYLMDGYRIRMAVIYIGDPTNPYISATYEHSATQPRGMKISNSHIFVADSQYGLYVIDITAPNYPRFSCAVHTAYQARGIAIKDTMAYIISWGNDSTQVFSALEVFNIADPETPAALGSYIEPNAQYFSVTVSGNYVYAVPGGYPTTMDIFDITDPLNPVLAGDLPVDYSTLIVESNGSSLYTSNVDMTTGGISQYDLTSPASPILTARYNSPAPFRDVTVIEDVAYICGDINVYSVNISDPYHPEFTSTYVDNRYHWNIYSYNNLLFTSAGGAGLIIYDAQDSDSLIFLSRLRMPGENDLYSNGNYVYMTSSRGLSVVDISNPAEPESVTVIPTPDVAIEICGEDTKLFVSTQNQNKLIEYDLSNPALPEMVASYVVDVIVSMAVDNHHLYTLDQWAYFKSYDISTPGILAGLDTVVLPMNGVNLHVDNNMAFFNCGSLQVYDISDPSNLRLVTSSYGNHFGGIGDVEFPYIYCASYDEMWILKLTPDGVIEPVIPYSPIALSANYPNPFNSSTSISYSLASGEQSTLTIFDICGRSVRSIPLKGSGNIVWNGRDDDDKPVSSGVYFYSIAGRPETVRKMLMIK